MTAYAISIISDTVCPWCYIGHKRLLSAISTHLSRHPTDTFSINWHAFQLNPQFPRGDGVSVSKRDYYNQKFGPGGADAVTQRVGQAARSAGIEMSFGGRTGNTFDSHRVIAAAGRKDAKTSGNAEDGGDISKGLQTKVVEELFRDYFERERDITSQDVLSEAAARAGMDKTEVRIWLKGEEEADVVNEELAHALKKDVHGVPHFTINDSHSVEGGQEPAAFAKLFETLKAEGV